LLAAQLKAVRADLGPNAKIDMVAVAANPEHQTLANVRHFIALHDLGNVNNFYFVTGKTTATKKVWADYGISVTNVPGDEMSIHSDYMFIISPKGYVRWIIPTIRSPGLPVRSRPKPNCSASYTIRACRNSSLIRE